MSYLDYNLKTVPVGWRKVLYVHWPLVFLLAAVSAVGFLMLYSVAGGEIDTWADPQMKRFAVGMVGMLAVGFTVESLEALLRQARTGGEHCL